MIDERAPVLLVLCVMHVHEHAAMPMVSHNPQIKEYCTNLSLRFYNTVGLNDEQ